MTTQQPQPETTFSLAELGAKFGTQLMQIFSEMIRLERIIAAQQAEIQTMAQKSVPLMDQIENLEIELEELRSANAGLENRNQHLEAEMAGMMTRVVVPGEDERK